MSNTIIEGEPITYDFLQQLARRVTELEAKAAANLSKSSQSITLAGSAINRTGKNTILCDGFDFNVDQNQTQRLEIKFDGVTFGAKPHIIATISDIPDEKGDAANIPYATIAIGNVTKTGFKCRVDLIKIQSKNTKLRVNYIAIGKTP